MWSLSSAVSALDIYDQVYTARKVDTTALRAAGPRRFDVTQVLCDASGDHLWALHGEVDLRQERDPELPLVRLIRIGT